MTRTQAAQADVAVASSIAAHVLMADVDLTALADLLPLIERMLAPIRGQRPVLRPLPTVEQIARERHLIQQEKDEAIENLRNGLKAQGKSPAPLSIATADAIITISGKLTEIERTLWRGIAACPWPPQRSDAARLQLVRANLRFVTSGAIAQRVSAAAASALRTAELLVDGEQVRRLDARCPYCHRESLVIYQTDPSIKATSGKKQAPSEIIRCDKPLGSVCQCQVDDCACKLNPARAARHRHVWRRDGGGWDALAKLLNQHNEATCTDCNGDA